MNLDPKHNPDIHGKRRDLFRGERPQEALRIIQCLNDAGFIAYLAGGCVRDALLGREPKDFDVATNATPESVREVFGKRNTLAFGASFGVIGVLPPRTKSSNAESASQRTDADEPLMVTEVATFRSDGEYSDGRRPDSVQYGDAKEDAMRRDFTINGMFYDPQSAQVIDYVGGLEDLESGVLRTIGAASDRFGEDKLRMLRAVRFATTLTLQVEPSTIAAIQQFAADISVVSGERIGAEMRKLVSSPNGAAGLTLLIRSELAPHVLPEIINHDPSEVSDCYRALRDFNFESAMAAALICSQRNASDVDAITSRWKLSNDESRRIKTTMNKWATVANTSGDSKWSMVQPTLIDRDAEYVVNVARAIVSVRHHDSGGIEKAMEALTWPRQKLDPPPVLTGDDLIRSGIKPGPAFAKILRAVRAGQLDGEIDSQEEAIEIARSML